MTGPANADHGILRTGSLILHVRNLKTENSRQPILNYSTQQCLRPAFHSLADLPVSVHTSLPHRGHSNLCYLSCASVYCVNLESICDSEIVIIEVHVHVRKHLGLLTQMCLVRCHETCDETLQVIDFFAAQAETVLIECCVLCHLVAHRVI